MKLEKVQRHSLKMIAVFFAVSLWFYVLNSEPAEVEKKIQLEFILPDGYAISNVLEKELTVKLKGAKAFIGSVLGQNEKITVDLNPYLKKFGKNFKVKYHPSLIRVPFGVDIMEMKPKDNWVELGKIVNVELPVKIQYIGTLGNDRKFIEESIDPKVVTVSGPVDVIKKISKVSTYPINLSNLENNEDESIQLSLEELDERLSFEESPFIKLKYRVEKIQLSKTKRN